MKRIWRKPTGSKHNQGIFCAVSYFHYRAPPGFCFNDACDEELIIDDEEGEDSNINSKAVGIFTKYKIWLIIINKTNFST